MISPCVKKKPMIRMIAISHSHMIEIIVIALRLFAIQQHRITSRHWAATSFSNIARVVGKKTAIEADAEDAQDR